MTTRKPVGKVVSSLRQVLLLVSLESPTISQAQLLEFLAHPTPPQDDLKLPLQPSVVVPLVQALRTQRVHLATNQLDQLPVPDIRARNQLLQVTLHHHRQVAPLAINQLVPLPVLVTQALKVHTQVPELQFHPQTCHRRTSHLKASHPSPTLLTPPLERHKRRPENICHHDEDKLLQLAESLKVILITHKTLMIDNSTRWTNADNHLHINFPFHD